MISDIDGDNTFLSYFNKGMVRTRGTQTNESPSGMSQHFAAILISGKTRFSLLRHDTCTIPSSIEGKGYSYTIPT